jgi:PKD repeat protein
MRNISRAVVVAVCFAHSLSLAASATLLGWNNLGMHCMDSDYSVFSILPPYNTVEAQLIIGGKLLTQSNLYTVTYRGVADADGSINTTAAKGNFHAYAQKLYGAALEPEQGLLEWPMPGLTNTPIPMRFEQTNHPAPGVAVRANWFRAEGIPITPYDDAGHKNPYPLMRLVASDSTGKAVATNDVVLPVSDEMDCRACHASGTSAAAMPAGGWTWNGLPERDYRLNILRLHDDRQFANHPDLYIEALAAKGFPATGLYFSVVAQDKPVLCAACHASEALGTASFKTIRPLTAAVHALHAAVNDPHTGLTLNNSANRSACYLCHPGSTTRCLRGAMGAAIGTDGLPSMQCQSCHGTMSMVGSTNRVGWFMEPNCQSCHSGTATKNSGQIRYTSAFTDVAGTVRTPADSTFATNPDTPAPGLSLFRFSKGHGGLQCEACHGSTHAEFPSSHANDNVRNIALQGHAGVMVECTACHSTMPNTASSGPHGMHAIGQGWISGTGGVTKHADRVEQAGGPAACRACHGLDYRGTVLSRAQADRTLTVSLEGSTTTLHLFRGAEIGCYTCHNGPSDENPNSQAAPTVSNVSGATSNDKPVTLQLPSTGTGVTLRIVSQPANGSVALSGNTATYLPSPGFVGTDTFTFAAYNGAKNSGLATGTVQVSQGPQAIELNTMVPSTHPALWPVAFNASAALQNSTGNATVQWDFGDNSPKQTGSVAAHTFASPGAYTWIAIASAGAYFATNTGVITITSPVQLAATYNAGSVTLSWPRANAGLLVEASPTLLPTPSWQVITNRITIGSELNTVSIPAAEIAFYRLRRTW